MPLSENEQRQLEAIERALMADDRKFADRVRSTDLRTHTRRRLVRAGLLCALGIVGLVLTFAGIGFGVAGFVLLFVGVLSGASALKRLRGGQDLPHRGVPGVPGVPGSGRGPGRVARPDSQGWRDRVEDRWKRRWEERD